MNKAMAELFDYFDGEQPSAALEKVLEVLERVNVRLISMHLFSWLTKNHWN
jgi:hypothetical protein